MSKETLIILAIAKTPANIVKPYMHFNDIEEYKVILKANLSVDVLRVVNVHKGTASILNTIDKLIENNLLELLEYYHLGLSILYPAILDGSWIEERYRP